MVFGASNHDVFNAGWSGCSGNAGLDNPSPWALLAYKIVTNGTGFTTSPGTLTDVYLAAVSATFKI